MKREAVAYLVVQQHPRDDMIHFRLMLGRDGCFKQSAVTVLGINSCARLLGARTPVGSKLASRVITKKARRMDGLFTWYSLVDVLRNYSEAEESILASWLSVPFQFQATT
jgi:hypothetical protein